MSGYTEACGVVESSSSLVATKGINETGQKGAWERVFYSPTNFKFDSIDAMKDEDNWNTAVAAGDLVYIGKGKFDDQGAEASFFEDTALGYRVKQTEATKVLGYQLLVCDCTNAELLKLDGRSGHLYFQTQSSYGIGRLEDDGKVSGLAADITVNLRSVATSDTPVEYSRLVFSFTTPKSDEMNPCSPKLDFLFSDIDQVERASYKVANVASNGSTLTADITLYKGCSSVKLEGVVTGDIVFKDKDGNDLSGTISETAGVYSLSATTALTLGYFELDGITTISDNLYITDKIRISTT